MKCEIDDLKRQIFSIQETNKDLIFENSKLSEENQIFLEKNDEILRALNETKLKCAEIEEKNQEFRKENGNIHLNLQNEKK